MLLLPDCAGWWFADLVALSDAVAMDGGAWGAAATLLWSLSPGFISRPPVDGSAALWD